MKIWEHADLCLSVAKINTYRQKGMSKEVLQWINELRGKLDDLQDYYRKEQAREKGQ